MALALSGGGDSVALLELAAEWARTRGRRLLALTIDHRLNPRSSAWTREAGEAARAVGADWRALSWSEARGGAGLQARARAARHALLAEAARAAGARVILTGHTADDAAEGDWMRGQGVSLGRLREWSPSPAWPQGRGLMLLRPLLGERRADLRGLLVERGRGWIEDPANADPRFARVRARAALASLAAAVEPDEAAAARGGAPRVRLSAGPLAWAGVLELGRDAPAAVLATALLCAGGGAAPPRGERLAALGARLARAEDFVAVLAGARIEAEGPRVRLMREPGEMRRSPPAPLTLRPGAAEVWDGRFEIVAPEPGWRVEAAAGKLARLSGRERAVLKSLPPAARSALPLLTRPGEETAVLAWSGAMARALAPRRLGLALGETTQEGDLFQRAHGETPSADLFSQH